MESVLKWVTCMIDQEESGYKNFDDSAYVNRAKAGDATAYETLVHQYFPMVYMIAFSRCGYDQAMAEELTQETFLRAWVHLDRLDKPTYFPLWVSRIAANLALDWMRKQRRTSALVALVERDIAATQTPSLSQSNPREMLSQKEETERLVTSLKHLSEEARELVTLHYIEEIPVREIARRLRLNASTVSRRLQKALHHLREIYDTNNFDDAKKTLLRDRQQLEKRTLLLVATGIVGEASQRTTLAAVADKMWTTPQLPLAWRLNWQALSTTTKIVVAGGIACLVAMAVFAFIPASETERRSSRTAPPPVREASTASIITPAESTGKVPRPSSEFQGAGEAAGSAEPTSHVDAVFSTTNAKAQETTTVVQGVVLDQHGQPVGNVPVHFFLIRFPDDPDNPTTEMLPSRQPVQAHALTQADAFGRFQKDFLYPETYIMAYVDWPPYVRAWHFLKTPVSESVTFRLTPDDGITYKGRTAMLDNGTTVPVPNATLDLLWFKLEVISRRHGDSETTMTFPFRVGSELVESDDDGYFEVDRVPVGVLTGIEARSKDHKLRMDRYPNTQFLNQLEPGTYNIPDVILEPLPTL